MADPRNFLLNSDYPLDKIVYLHEDSMVVPDGTDDNITPGITIAHGLDFTPFPELTWSNSSSFSTAYSDWDETYAISAGSGAMPALGQYYEVRADDTNIYITRYNFSGSSKTVYYRIFAFPTSDTSVDATVSATSDTGNPFILNTSKNYMKLESDGKLTNSGGATTSYNHGLSFVPRVRYRAASSGLISWRVANQLVYSDLTGSGGQTNGVHVDQNNLTWLNPSGFDELYYRVYADE